MITEDDEFKRIESEIKRRAARDEDDDTQVYVKPWIGLTVEEKVLELMFDAEGRLLGYEEYANAIETKLKEKNT